jgi:hypothetical protein
MVDDEAKLISKIRKEFGIKDTTKRIIVKLKHLELHNSPYYEAPIPHVPQQSERLVRKQSMVEFDDDELSDMTRKDIEDILGGIISQIERDDDKPAVGLTLASVEDIGDVDDDDLLAFDGDEPVPLMREASRETELSALITKVEDLELLNYDE